MRLTPVLVTAALAATLLAAIVFLRSSRIPPASNPAPAALANPQPQDEPAHESPAQSSPTRDRWRKSTTTGPTDTSEPDTEPPLPPARLAWVNELIGRDGPKPVRPETVQRWLASGRTNALDLLALHRAGAGSEFLDAALQNFPNDPRTLLASIIGANPADLVRERLDRLRAADPKNPLAHYLSAWNAFRNGDPEQALNHLINANQSSSYNDYTLDIARTTEELRRMDGESEAAALANSTWSTQLPHLSHLKRLSTDLAALQQEFIAAGDLAGAESLASSGVHLAKHLMDGSGSKTLIGELVGIAVGSALTRNLPSSTSYPFLNGTPADFQANLQARREDLRALSGPQADAWIRDASEQDILNYFNALRTYGESTALRWRREEEKAAAPTRP